MKYRILIRSVNINIVSFNWLLVGNSPWETEDKLVALEKFQELLKDHSFGNLTLVQAVPVDISVTANTNDGDGEEEGSGEDNTDPEIEEPGI